MLKFLSKNINAFGLDLSGGSFKLMQFGTKGKDMVVKGYHSAFLPKGMVVNEAVSDPKTFAFLLNQALEKPQYGKFDSKCVVASLPESKSFVRVIQIPKMSETEAENAVPYEAENFIPMPIDQVYLDWQKIGDNGDKMNVLMIASPKDFADSYLDVLDKAGLKPAALEVESQSCHRALVNPSNGETVLLVDISDSRTSLMMIEEGNLQFTSTIPIAGNAFTESIARSLGVSGAKAEEIKIKIGIANTSEYPNVQTALLPILNNLSAEIKNILKFHAEHSQKQASKVLLLGGSARLKNLAEFLGPQLQDAGVVQVQLAEPWQVLPRLKIPPLDALQSLGFVTAIGLAARGANLEVS